MNDVERIDETMRRNDAQPPCRRRAIEALRAQEAAKAAQSAILNRSDGYAMRNEGQEGQAQGEAALKVCPRCGRAVGRGSYMHLKHCKG